MSKVSQILNGLVYGVAVDQGSGLEAAIKEARGAASQDDDLLTFQAHCRRDAES